MKACQKYQSIRNMEAIMPWRPKTTFTFSIIFSSNDPVKKGAVLIELWGYEIISFSYGIDMLNFIYVRWTCILF